jgi:hypothetical protein
MHADQHKATSSGPSSKRICSVNNYIIGHAIVIANSNESESENAASTSDFLRRLCSIDATSVRLNEHSTIPSDASD